MMRSCMVVVLAALAAGCGGSVSPPQPGSTSASASVLASLPATVEGSVVFDVIEGDGEFGDYADWNFGTLTLDGEDIVVEADGAVLQSLQLPESGGRVRATISSVKTESGVPMYRITSIEAL